MTQAVWFSLSQSRLSSLGTAGAALALAGMGLLNLTFGDTLLQWQPLPPWVPGHTAIAYLSGLPLIAAAASLALGKARANWAAMAGGWILLWAIVLHLPLVWAAGGTVASLNGTAENLAMAAGLAILAGRWAPLKPRTLRAIFGLCCMVFGTAHFVYAGFTAGMIPGWLPHHLVLTYFTGAVHVGTGLLLLLDFWPSVAGMIEGAMMASFVILLHLPRVTAAPGSRLELTMLTMAVMLTSAAWLIAASAMPSEAAPDGGSLDREMQA